MWREEDRKDGGTDSILLLARMRCCMLAQSNVDGKDRSALLDRSRWVSWGRWMTFLLMLLLL